MLNTPLKTFALVLALGLVLTGCSSQNDDATTAQAPEASSGAATTSATIRITDNHGTQTVPKKPQRIAVTDNRSFEILAQWNIPLVAAPKALIPATVSTYKSNKNIADIGSHREPNVEALAAANPDLIINGQRFRDHYEDIAALNPDAAL